MSRHPQKHAPQELKGAENPVSAEVTPSSAVETEQNQTNQPQTEVEQVTAVAPEDKATQDLGASQQQSEQGDASNQTNKTDTQETNANPTANVSANEAVESEALVQSVEQSQVAKSENPNTQESAQEQVPVSPQEQAATAQGQAISQTQENATKQAPNADDFLAHIGHKVNMEALKQRGKWAIFNFWTYYIIANFGLAIFFLAKFKSVEAFIVVLVLGFGGSLYSLLRSKHDVCEEVGAVKIGPNHPQFGWLYDMVDYLAYKAKLPNTPEVAVYSSPDMNAFAVGATQSSAMVAFSTALLEKMTPEEIAAVAGHEIGHIVSRDMMGTALIRGSVKFTALVITFPLWCLKFLIMFYIKERSWITICDLCIKVVTACVNAVGWLLERAFSRHREYHADKRAALLTSPAHMQQALYRLSLDVGTPLPSQPSLDCYRISGRLNFFEWFSTHPTLEHRFEALNKELGLGGNTQGANTCSTQQVQLTNVDLGPNSGNPAIAEESKEFHNAKLAAIAAGAVGLGMGAMMMDEAVAAEQTEQEQATQAQQAQPQPAQEQAAPQEQSATTHSGEHKSSDSHSKSESSDSSDEDPVDVLAKEESFEEPEEELVAEPEEEPEDEDEDDDDGDDEESGSWLEDLFS